VTSTSSLNCFGRARSPLRAVPIRLFRVVRGQNIRFDPCPSVVDILCAFVALLFNFRVWPPARPENDRKTTGFTKPLSPEFNLGKEKVKFW
jgi:hypothetical protein